MKNFFGEFMKNKEFNGFWHGQHGENGLNLTLFPYRMSCLYFWNKVRIIPFSPCSSILNLIFFSLNSKILLILEEKPFLTPVKKLMILKKTPICINSKIIISLCDFGETISLSVRLADFFILKNWGVELA